VHNVLFPCQEAFSQAKSAKQVVALQAPVCARA